MFSNCYIAIVAIAITIGIANSFMRFQKTVTPKCSSNLLMSLHNEPISQKDITSRALEQGLRYATAFSATAALLTIGQKPANADSLKDVNSKLSEYGLPPMLYVPSGFSPLVSEFGRGNIREAMNNPILVQFAYPALWVVRTTTVNTNGEAGTVSANDYIKGDSSFLFVDKDVKPAQPIQAISKDYLTSFIRKGITQKGDSVDSLKVFQITKGAPVNGSGNQDYLFADFEYELNTEAGFLISRRGVLALTSASKVPGENLQGLFSISTSKRWRSGLESTLRQMAESFRVYRLNSGIFATE